MPSSQFSSSTTCRTILPTQDSLFVDSLSVVPQSLLLIYGQDTLKQDQYDYNYSTGYLVFDDSFNNPRDKLTICYRTLPFSFHQIHARRDLSVYDSTAMFQEIRYADRYASSNISSQETLINTPKLQKSGSLSRGISFGNRQDIFVNASLNLQLEGKLTDDLSIRAAITDQNVPLQPDGTTQQLQQFDNVFIEFMHQNATLRVGDVQLRHPGSSVAGASRNTSMLGQSQYPYFLRYRRNVQGGILDADYKVGKHGKAKTSVGAALAKGKFASISLSIQEGIQGPYRLNSPENMGNAASVTGTDRMFYILANSEKVYHNGQLLERGFDRDYTIDYNLGELTFTPKVVLTQFSRITVDFEYADRSYSRSIITANHQQTYERVSFSVNYYQEGDHARRPIGFELSPQNYQLLSDAGDQPLDRMVAAVDTITGQSSGLAYGQRDADVPGVGNVYQVLYNQQDTVVAGQTYQVFVFSASEQAIYRPYFSYVGERKGNYVMKNAQVNGKVYEWVAPTNSGPQGNYEPVRQLPAPQRRSVLSIGSQVSLSKYDQLYTEVAISEVDVNTLSSLDQTDDQGKALVIGYRSQPRPLATGSAYRWSQQLQYEYTDRYFQPIDPYRSVDFERNWAAFPLSSSVEQPTRDDHIIQSQTLLEKDIYNRIQYRWVGRKRTNGLQGQQHELTAAHEWGGFRFSGYGFTMQSQYPYQNASWKRLTLDVNRPTKWITPGYTYRREENEVRNAETDSVLYSAEHYDEHQWYLMRGDSIKGAFRIDYRIRNNRLPLKGEMQASEQVQMLQASWDKALGEQHRLKLITTYRYSQTQNAELWAEHRGGPSPENSIMGQLDWAGNLLKKSLQMSLTYAIANGREIKRDFVYVRVPAGEGMFTWRDDNGNGIEEIDEFYEANYWDERNYVRVLVPTNEYIQAFTNQLNYRVKAQFPQAWSEGKGVKALLARFSNVSQLSMQQKQTDDRLAARILPGYDVLPEALLSSKESVRSTFFFNRQNSRFGVEGGWRSTRWKQLLQQGSEDRQTKVYQGQLRWQFSRKWQTFLNTEQENRRYQLSLPTTQNTRRNFNIASYQVSPEIHWQPHMDIRLITKVGITRKTNQGEGEIETGGEEASIRSVGWEWQSRKVMQRNINASLELLNIDYNADTGSPVAYEMLEGLLPGGNARWSLNMQQQLLEGLQLTINYQGRKSPEQAAVHSGSLSVRALF
uniref:Cell surface protein SprA n=1 Tax=Roseihalotalea indica TaxID=2867963 RepID=A0AA49JIU6_9BACT|nr:hypothetical protein K4G66_31590 [Tunicatimonas sp. TK19036]